MPEGAEVKRLTHGLDTKTAGKIIASASVIGGRYLRASPEVLGLNKLAGATIERVSCKGKLIVFHLKHCGEAFAALSTLGMTGWWVFDSADRPNKRIELQFTDGSSAVFVDQRNFGTIKVVTYNEMKRKLAELGPDILTHQRLWDSIVYPEFLARVSRFGKSQRLGEALLDQRISAGCGNYIRADAMYLARLSPLRPMSGLTDAELKRVWRAMHEVASAAHDDRAPCDAELSDLDLGSDQFFNIAYHRTHSPRGNAIESYKDKHNRTVWWCPQEQT